MSKIVLSVIAGPRRGESFMYTRGDICTIGRGADCAVQLHGDAHLSVSRQHCQIDMTSPTIRICDLGSLNGTYVNGRLIGRRPLSTGPQEYSTTAGTEVDLEEGDTIQVGGTLFQVCIDREEPVYAGTEVVEEPEEEAELLAGCKTS
jgi:pSer/pThr/pTyr-binding forkhead associated (FHA) protein